MCFIFVFADIYGPQIGRSSVLDTALHKLKVTIDQEVFYTKQLLEVIGQLDTLFSASQQVHSSIQNGGLMSHDHLEELTLQPSAAAKETWQWISFRFLAFFSQYTLHQLLFLLPMKMTFFHKAKRKTYRFCLFFFKCLNPIIC